MDMDMEKDRILDPSHDPLLGFQTTDEKGLYQEVRTDYGYPRYTIHASEDLVEVPKRSFFCLDPRWDGYKFVILAVTCLLTFGSYYAYDQPSVLQSELQTTYDLSGVQYNLFYWGYSAANAVFVLVAGWLIDKTNNRIGALLFACLVLIGQLLFAFGASIDVYAIMLLGRLVFGTGGGPISVCQNAISANYFKSSLLSVAFGITLTCSRLGSILNFIITPSIEETSGLPFSLWFGGLLCLFSVCMAWVFYMLDERQELIVGRPSEMKNSKKIELKSIIRFPLAYWVLSITTMLFYVCVFAFIADASDFFQDQFTMEPSVAAYYAGLAYDISIIGAPTCGILLDSFGYRTLWIIFGSCIVLPAFAIFQFTNWNPAVGMVMLGIGYSIESASLWSTVPLLVSLNEVGTAGGVMTSIQMLGISFGNLAVGALLDAYGYSAILYFFMAVCLLTICFASLLMILDLRAGGKLWRYSRKTAATQDISTLEQEAGEVEPE